MSQEYHRHSSSQLFKNSPRAYLPSTWLSLYRLPPSTHRRHPSPPPPLVQVPTDANTYPIDVRFFSGDSVLVSPVTQENSTSVDIYLPKDIFCDFARLAPVQSTGSTIALNNVNFTTTSLHIRSGAVLPLRVKSAVTTPELRKKDFEFVVAPVRTTTHLASFISMTAANMCFKCNKLDVRGSFSFAVGVKVGCVRFLNVQGTPREVKMDGRKVNASDIADDATNKVLDVCVNVDINKNFR